MRLAILTLLCACGSSQVPPDQHPAPPAPSGDPLPAGILEPPFRAAVLRDGLPVGTVIDFRIAAAGKPTVVQRWRFTAADADGCTVETVTYAEDGATVLADEGAETHRWSELEGHAHFPAARTTRREASIDVPAGHFDTWYFEVAPEHPGEPTRRFHFARNLPGPPVWMQVIQDGQVVMSMELLARTPPPTGPASR